MDNSENLDDDFTHSGGQIKIPGATTALVCGIISIPFAGLVGIILGIVAISSAGNAIKTYNLTPNKYMDKSLNNAKTGRVCGIIGIVASALWMAYAIGNFYS